MNRSRLSSRTFRKLMHRGILFPVLMLLAACSSLTSVVDRTAPQSREITVPVVRGDITSSMNFVGNLQYSQSATLTWKTGGVIGTLSVKPGDQVQQGDTLAVLESESLSSSVLLSEKTIIEQQERLEDIQSSESARMLAYQTLTAKETALKNAKLRQEALYYPRATREEMERAWDKLALASLNFNYAKQDYDILVANNSSWGEGAQPARTVYYFRRLYDLTSRQPTFEVSSMTFGADDRSSRQRKFEDYVSTYNTLVSAYENYLWTAGEPSATDYAVAEGNVRVAQMEYDQALADYLSYESLPRTKDVNAAEILLKNAETVYNQRSITAPFSGTVTAVNAFEGSYVTRGTAAVRLDDMSRIFIPISVPELDLSSVSGGTAVTVTVDAISGRTYSGHIYSVAEAGTASGAATSFSTVVEIDDPDDRMLAGMTAEISMPLQTRTGVLLIPNAAISYPDGTPSVTVVDGDTRRTVGIRLGTVGESISEVISGNLPEGTLLAVSSISPEVLTQLGLDPSAVMGSDEAVPEPARPEVQSPENSAEPSAFPAMPDAERPGGQNRSRMTEPSVPFEGPSQPVSTARPTRTPLPADVIPDKG